MDTTSGVMPRRSARWPFLVAAGAALLALVALLVAPPLHRAWTHHQNADDARHQRQAEAVAARVTLPAAYSPTDRLGGEPCVDPAVGDDPGQRCWLVPTTPMRTTPDLSQALRSVGLSPQKPSCRQEAPLTLRASTPAACRVAATVNGWDVDLIAIPNIVFAKLVRPKPGQPFVRPKSHIDGTEVIVSVD